MRVVKVIVDIKSLIFSRFGGKDPAYHEFTVGKCYIYLCSTLTMRGWNTLPSKLPARIALFSLIFFGTMFFWHWEAMLISYLATRTISLPFKDITDLMINTQYRIILAPGTSYVDDFRTSTDPIWQAAWTDRVQPYLEEHVGFMDADFADKIQKEGLSAWYDLMYAAM